MLAIKYMLLKESLKIDKNDRGYLKAKEMIETTIKRESEKSDPLEKNLCVIGQFWRV